MSGLEQLYQQVILDHSKQRTGEGLAAVDAGGAMVGESFQVNPTCGDEVTLRVSLHDGDAGPEIATLGWEGVGCSISRASLSVMTELVTGRSVREADDIAEVFRRLMDNRGEPLDEADEEILGDGAAFVGVGKFPARIKCALLGWMALRDAVAKATTTT